MTEINKTVEKMHLIKKLMDEIESEVRQIALLIKDQDLALYRMLAEGCSDQFKIMSKNYQSPSSGNQIDSWTKQLEYAEKLIEESLC